MKSKSLGRTVRRSVALPRELLDEVRSLAPPELRQNLNGLVRMALKDFAARQKARAFEELMAQMAADPSIRSENAAISKIFKTTEGDGLKDD